MADGNTGNGAADTAPVVILVEPQLGENIGMCARAMGNFALSRLRLVRPRDGWPNPAARRSAAGADAILDNAALFDSVEAAVADCRFLLATSARPHDQAKPVIAPDAAMAEAAAAAAGATVGILFGRERWGLTNAEVGLADRIVTFPVDPDFASLNLAQAVLLMGYEWFRHARGGALPHLRPQASPRASQAELQAFFDHLVRVLDDAEFLRPAEKRDTMLVNLRNIFTRMAPTAQDILTLHGVVQALAQGRKGSAQGGVLDGEGAQRLRALVAGQSPQDGGDGGSLRGLAQLLRRNPTDAERALWAALKTDRRFAGRFKRQTPVGRHIPGFVSFPDRVAIELIEPGDDDATRRARDDRRAWLEARRYRVVWLDAAAIAADLDAVLTRLQAALGDGADSA